MDAKRLGCLYIPELRIQVHRRDEGLDPGEPLILISHQGQRQIVTAVSAEAAAAGVRTGMTLTQAEVACPGVRVREEDPGRYATAGQALLAEMLSLAPVHEAVRLGLYYLGMKGLRWLYQDEAALLRTLLERTARAGLTASASAAGTRFTALAAALTAPPGSFRQVRSGDERAFLAPLPLSILPASEELLERLRLLGITTLGEYAALPPRSVERRYGAEGVRLYRLARAEDESHLDPTPHPSPRQAGTLLEDPAGNAEGLLFVLSPLVERLLDELAHEGRACAGLDLHLRLEGGATIDVPVMLGSPVTVAKPVLELMRLKLARLELPAGVIELRIEASRVTAPSAPQGDLFRRVGSPSGMAVTLARLTDALGSEAVVVSELVDNYRIDRTYALQPVQHGAAGLLAAAAGEHPGRKRARKTGSKPGAAPPPPGSGGQAGRSAPTLSPGQAGAAGRAADRPREASAGQPGEASAGQPGEASAGRAEGETDATVRSGFRRLDPPRPLEVHEDEDGPDAVTTQGRRREVITRRGPFRYGGSWWEAGFDRDYFELTLSDGIDLLVFRDRSRATWWVEGVYD